MIILKNTVSGNEIELTQEDIDAIYDAMGDYQDYGDDEATLSESIRDKLYQI